MFELCVVTMKEILALLLVHWNYIAVFQLKLQLQLQLQLRLQFQLQLQGIINLKMQKNHVFGNYLKYLVDCQFIMMEDELLLMQLNVEIPKKRIIKDESLCSYIGCFSLYHNVRQNVSLLSFTVWFA